MADSTARIRLLEAELAETRERLAQEKARLRHAREEWERTFDAIEDYVTILAPDKRILRLNRAIADAFGCRRSEAVGKPCHQAFWGRETTCTGCPAALVLDDRRPHTAEFENRRVGKCFLVSASPIIDPAGRIEGIVYVTKDITFKKEAEKNLRRAYADMERKVRERTAELDFKSSNLEEANTALRMMLKAREEDRRELEARMTSNIEKLVRPCLDRLRQTRLSDAQREYLGLLESHVREMLSPFANTLASPVLNLTPREIQVANMVKNGRTNKEMASLLGVSIRAVEFHRENIRRKLGLTRRKANLRAHLMSLP